MKNFALFLAVGLALFSCKKDDEQPVIAISEGSSSYVVVNDCQFTTGDPGTQFIFTLDYNAPSNIEIDGLEFDLLWSDGDESQNIFEDDFDIMNGSLDFDWCFRFGGTDWVEVSVKILANDETIESSPFVIRVEKPTDAN